MILHLKLPLSVTTQLLEKENSNKYDRNLNKNNSNIELNSYNPKDPRDKENIKDNEHSCVQLE